MYDDCKQQKWMKQVLWFTCYHCRYNITCTCTCTCKSTFSAQVCLYVCSWAEQILSKTAFKLIVHVCLLAFAVSFSVRLWVEMLLVLAARLIIYLYKNSLSVLQLLKRKHTKIAAQQWQHPQHKLYLYGIYSITPQKHSWKWQYFVTDP